MNFIKAKGFRVMLALALLAATLMGCSLAPGGAQYKALAETAVNTAIDDRKDFNDAKAAVTVQAVCGMSVGAFYRLQDTAWKEGVRLICSSSGISNPAPQL
jgi:hypothetical protein